MVSYNFPIISIQEYYTLSPTHVDVTTMRAMTGITCTKSTPLLRISGDGIFTKKVMIYRFTIILAIGESEHKMVICFDDKSDAEIAYSTIYAHWLNYRSRANVKNTRSTNRTQNNGNKAQPQPVNKW